MPAGYEKMVAKFRSEGLSPHSAATKAAKIWNSKNKRKVRRGHKSKTVMTKKY